MERINARWCPRCGGIMSLHEAMSGRLSYVCRNSLCRCQIFVSLLEERTSYGMTIRVIGE